MALSEEEVDGLFPTKLLRHCHSRTQREIQVRMWGNWNPCALLVGMENGTAATENSTEAPQEIKNRTTILSSNPTSWYLSKRIEIRIWKR